LRRGHPSPGCWPYQERSDAESGAAAHELTRQADELDNGIGLGPAVLRLCLSGRVGHARTWLGTSRLQPARIHNLCL
jgi:hypothetical protein